MFSALTWRGKIAWLIGAALSVFVPHLVTAQDLMDAYDNLLQENKYEVSDVVSDIGYLRSAFVQPKMMKSFFKEPKPHRFEGYEIMLPSEIEAYCINKFGPDYMQLPPESKRISTHDSSKHATWWLGPTNN